MDVVWFLLQFRCGDGVVRLVEPLLDSDSEGMVNDGGLWAWLVPCFTSGEVVVGDVVKITMETKDGWSRRE